MDWVTWTVLPAVGGALGWIGNRLAIAWLLHPRRPVLGVQGLLPRRQQQLAASIGRAVGGELPTDELLKSLDQVDLAPVLGGLLDQAISAKLEEVRKIPLIGGFITAERVSGIRDSVLKSLVESQPALIAKLKHLAREKIDIGRIVEEKLATFDLDRLERILDEIAGRELRAVAWCGALLGVVIGVVQAAILTLR